MKILLVEDDGPWTELMIELFQYSELDVTVEHAKDGLEALTFLSHGEPPDLIISDMRMPRMDGHDLLQEVRSNATLRTVPFIMLSSTSCDKGMREAHGCKATCHITKTYFISHQKSMIACIKDLIDTAVQEVPESRFPAQGPRGQSSKQDTANSI